MKILIEIDCSSAAFNAKYNTPQAVNEIKRIFNAITPGQWFDTLAYYRDKLKHGPIILPLRDINGNKVGKLEVIEEESTCIT